jgi:hypothetical protein
MQVSTCFTPKIHQNGLEFFRVKKETVNDLRW